MSDDSVPLRVLQVFNQYLEKGGEEIWVDTLASLACEGLDITELRFQSSDWVGDRKPGLFAQAKQVWDSDRSREQLRAMASAFRPQVLLYHNLIPVGSLGLYDEAERLGLPVVQYIHNYRPFSPSGTMWMAGRTDAAALHGNPWPEVASRAWEKSFFKTLLIAVYQMRLIRNGGLDGVKRWIAVSDFMRDRFVEAGIDPLRVRTLRHCWRYGEESADNSTGDHYLFLGRLVSEKGVHTLLDAWAILEKNLGARCPRLVIAGSGPEKEAVMRRLNRMRKVVCVGYVAGETKRKLLAQCRALVAPSIWWEPLGLIVYEAYDLSKPVLAASTGGMTETVIPGLTGLLHPAGDAAALARDIERIEAMSAGERAAMGHAGRQWLVENADPGRWRDGFTAIIREAMEGP